MSFQEGIKAPKPNFSQILHTKTISGCVPSPELTPASAKLLVEPLQLYLLGHFWKFVDLAK